MIDVVTSLISGAPELHFPAQAEHPVMIEALQNTSAIQLAVEGARRYLKHQDVAGADSPECPAFPAISETPVDLRTAKGWSVFDNAVRGIMERPAAPYDETLTSLAQDLASQSAAAGKLTSIELVLPSSASFGQEGVNIRYGIAENTEQGLGELAACFWGNDTQVRVGLDPFVNEFGAGFAVRPDGQAAVVLLTASVQNQGGA